MTQKPSIKKPLLLLVPHYVGSLKYFEKFLPYLADRYDTQFLLIFGRRSFKDMTVYARSHRLPFLTIAPPKVPSILCRLPFYVTIVRAKHYGREVTQFLDVKRPAKIIATNDQGFYMGYLMREANQRGVETKVLQWALTYPGQRILPKKAVVSWRRILYCIGKPLYVKIRDILIAAALGEKSYWSKGMIGAGRARQFGVINKQAYDWFDAKGIPKEKMEVVGYLDFDLSREIRDLLAREQNKRNEAATRHNINLNKQNIIFYSTPFNRKDTAILSDEAHYAMTDAVIKTVRSVCPTERFDILFKPHPSETAEQYRFLDRYGVKFVNPLGNNNELIALSDLYIAGVSTTNFIPLAMEKEALFVNLAKLPQVESARPFFGIKKFVTDPVELQLLISQFADGKLPKQYLAGEEIITKNSLQKILRWI